MSADPVPPAFISALTSLRDAQIDAGLTVREVPAPDHLAPWAAAVEVATGESASATGRGTLVILFDLDQEDIWGAPMRLVGHARMRIDSHQSADPLLGEVIWSTLQESLREAGAEPLACVGTVTREISETFGGLELQGGALHADLRCSWTAAEETLTADLEGWAEALRRNCGLMPQGVTPMEGSHD